MISTIATFAQTYPGQKIIGTSPAQSGRPLSMAQLTPGNPEFIYAPSLLNARWNERGELDFDLPDHPTTASVQPKQGPGLASADGMFRAICEGDRLFVLNVADSSRHEISDPNLSYAPIEGQSDIVWGQSVHRNEFGIEGGLFWSPSGHQLAFYRMDQSMVESYPLVRTDDPIASVAWMKYPMAGRTSHQVQLGIYNPETHAIVYLQTGMTLANARIPEDHLTNGYTNDHDALVRDPEHYLTCVTWRPDGKQIFVAELNRLQNYMELNVYDTATGEYVETIFSQEGAKYVEPEHALYFLPGSNDRFIWQDERDGFDHLYLYDLGRKGKPEVSEKMLTTRGALGTQLTMGSWVVTELLGVDPKRKKVFFMATKESPIESHLYSVDLDTRHIEKLTREPGRHSIILNPEFTKAYDVYSNHSTPRICQTIDLKSGRRSVLFSALNPFIGYARPEVEVGTIKASDGLTNLFYRLVKPTDFDPSKQYPVVVYLYNGPHAQLVTNGYQFGLPGWDCYMAQQGFVVFTIDGRGSANRGLAFEQTIWHDLGRYEAEDQMRGIAFLESLSYIDRSRIGIYGWSYGGFMSTYMMLHHPETFSVGVAGGPVLDWRRYEVMYGERYMGNPVNNAQAYEENAQINHTGRLKGRLLLIHDDQDATVVPQMSLQFLNNSVKEGNTYPDFIIYPNHGHNVRGRDRIHLQTRIAQYFIDHLQSNQTPQ